MPLNYNGVAMKKVNQNGAALKKVNFNGVQVYTAEKTVATNLSVSTFNHVDYWAEGWGWYTKPTSTFNLSDWDSVTISYSISASHSGGSAPNGTGFNLAVHLRLNDGTMVKVGTHWVTLYENPGTKSVSGSKTLTISGYSSSQLSNCAVTIGIGDFYDPGGVHRGVDATLKVSKVFAF